MHTDKKIIGFTEIRLESFLAAESNNLSEQKFHWVSDRPSTCDERNHICGCFESPPCKTFNPVFAEE